MRKVLVDVPDALAELAREWMESVEDLASRVLVEWTEDFLEDARDARVAVERWQALQRGEITERDWDELVTQLTRRRAAGAPWCKDGLGCPSALPPGDGVSAGGE